MNPQEFQTERLLLRAVSSHDAAFVLALLNTPKWIEYIGDRNVSTEEQAKEYIENRMITAMNQNGFGNYVLVRKHDGACMGTCGLYKREGIQGVDIGFAMLPEFEKMGYMYEAAIKIKEVAHSHFQISLLNGITLPRNKASRALLEKLGLRLKKTVFLPNDPEELLLYSMDLP